MENVYNLFKQFMDQYDLNPHDIPNYPGYQCDRTGNVYRPNGSRVTPFNSSGYKQAYLKDEEGNRSVKGIHQLIAMTFDEEYYDGCVVHHKDENKCHNWDENLEVESREEHSRHHADPSRLANYINEYGPANKGKKMSPEFCEKCRQSALNRKDNQNRKFQGNQFVNADGSKKS